jgi:uncharacterized protein (TIGR00255 family)
MKSMTGYGRSNSSDKQKTKNIAEAWVRSVNGRFLEIRVHVPREWAELEPEIRSLAQEYLGRGTVDIHVSRLRGLTQATNVEIDEGLAKQWAVALRKLAKAAGFKPSQVSFEMVAKAQDVVRAVNQEDLSIADKGRVIQAVAEALRALEREKVREGKSIQEELLSLLTELDDVVMRVDELARAAPDDLQARFKQRMDRLEATGIKGPKSDDSRFHQEVALLIDRGDIREEITRLTAHLRVYRDLIQTARFNKRLTKLEMKGVANGINKAPPSREGEIGKTLDFYAQELLREVNTIGSKSQTAELTRIVVEAKTLVEKIREQVQNVE